MKEKILYFIPFVFLMFLKQNTFGQSIKREAYDLLHPVPNSHMRELETDRPDVTESPYTVDAGHIQYEADLIRLARERGTSFRSRSTMLNQGNLKLGITRNISVQFGFQSYVWERKLDTEDGLTMGHAIGDINIRIKHNLLGNDAGNFALAILPFIKLPTAQYTEDSRYEGGIIVPMLLKLPGEWKLGSEVEADRLEDVDAHAIHTMLLQSLTLSHDLFKNLEGIAETYYRYDFHSHHWKNYLNAAAQLEVTRNFKVDAGLNYGLQSDAEKNYFIGTSFRF